MDERVYTEIERLRSLRIPELRARYREAFGEDARTAHKPHLVRQIAWRLQVQAQGDLSERARRRGREIANDADRKTQVPPHRSRYASVMTQRHPTSSAARKLTRSAS